MSLEIFGAIDLSSTGLRGQRARLEVVSENIANAETTSTPEGGPYRRKRVLLQQAASGELKRIPLVRTPAEFAQLVRTHQRHLDATRRWMQLQLPRGASLQVDEALDATRFRRVFDPGHPDADQDGFVLMPNVNVVTEMVDLIAASRSYEANVSAIEAAKDMFLQALEI